MRAELALAQGRRERLAAARLYACTPIREDLAELADALFEGGVDLVQLRDKEAEAKQLLDAAPALRHAADRHGGLFVVNDRADVALAAGADACHLGQDDLPLPWARRVLGDGVLLGRSTHSLAQARAALAEDWDYVVTGPVYPTATKPGRPATGLDLLRQVAGLEPGMPWFAIGGIDLATIDDVTAAGAGRAVVVRALIDAPDPAAAARALRAKLSAALPEASCAPRPASSPAPGR